MLYVHILAGLVALVAGFVALLAAKGAPMHRRAGTGFGVAMLVMTASAVVMATFLRPPLVYVVAGTVTFYLVATGWLTVARPRAPVRGLLAGLMLVGAAGGGAALEMGLVAAQSPRGSIEGIPFHPLLMFGTVGLVGAALDARMLLAGSIGGRHRLARHLWRMGFALWVATASFFLGQADLFPAPLRQAGLLALPVLAVAGVMLYWTFRVLVQRRRAIPVAARTVSPTRGFVASVGGAD